MKINLKPGQTMSQHDAEDRRTTDALRVYHWISSHPGITKSQLAADRDLSIARVEAAIRYINTGAAQVPQVKYGPIYAKGGPHAGNTVWGWYCLNDQRHHVLLDHSDKHSARVEIGVRRSRLVSLALAHGIVGAESYIASIEERIGETVEAMSARDFEAFSALVAELLKPEA